MDAFGYGRSEIERAIDEWIVGRNAQRNREILKRRFIDGITFEMLAAEFELSVKQVQRIVYSGRRIFSHIGGERDVQCK